MDDGSTAFLDQQFIVSIDRFPQIRPIGHKCVQPVPKKAFFYLGSPLRLPTPNRLAQYDFPGEMEKLI